MVVPPAGEAVSRGAGAHGSRSDENLSLTWSPAGSHQSGGCYEPCGSGSPGGCHGPSGSLAWSQAAGGWVDPGLHNAAHSPGYAPFYAPPGSQFHLGVPTPQQVTLSRVPAASEVEGSVVLLFPETLHCDRLGQTFVAIFPTLLELDHEVVVVAPKAAGGARRPPVARGDDCEAESAPNVPRRRSGKPRPGRRSGRGRGGRGGGDPTAEPVVPTAGPASPPGSPEMTAAARRRRSGLVDVQTLYCAEGAAAACRAIRGGADARRRHVEALRGQAIELVGRPHAEDVLQAIVETMPEEHLSGFLTAELQEGLVEALKRPDSEVLVLCLLERERCWPPGFETRLADALTPLVRALPRQDRLTHVLRKCLKLQPATRTLSSRVAFACCGQVDTLVMADGLGLLEAALAAGHVSVARSLVASLFAVRQLASDEAGARLLARAAALAEELRAELLRQVQRLPSEQQLALPPALREALCWRPPSAERAGDVPANLGRK